MSEDRANLSKGNILIVDDTPINLRLLSAILTEQEYTVRKALNGQMALTACQAILPDLILLDIMMPEMDGYEVCYKLKADEKTRDVPVIFISALDQVIDKVRAFEAGAVDYITKPFQGAEVVSRVKLQLQLRSLQLKLQKQNLSLQHSEALLKAQKQQLEQALGDLQHAQSQLVQQEKMIGLGQLVAGISHEINNPVNFIYGNLNYAGEYVQDLVELLKVYQEEYPERTPKIQEITENLDIDFIVSDLQKLINSMRMGAERIRTIVLALRIFSKLDEASLKPVNIHEGIDSTLLILQHRLKESETRCPIEIIKEYGQLPKLTCYASQLNQVFFNLLNNAIDALEEQRIYENQSPDRVINQPQIRIFTELTSSNTAIIKIADNGPGIPEQLRSRLFDPFFTTKPVGRGTGLGLSICYQIIVEKHKGKITCNSTLGEGAEFMIEIPVYQAENQ